MPKTKDRHYSSDTVYQLDTMACKVPVSQPDISADVVTG